MKRSESIKSLAAALAKAQSEIENAKREHTAKVEMRTGGSYSYNYADLASVMEVVRKPLADNYLSFVQIPSATSTVKGEGQNQMMVTVVEVTTMLMHSSGEWIESDPLALPVADSKPQTIGSGITYARRYSLSAILGVAFDSADDDGNAASGNEGAQTQQRQRVIMPPCPACGRNEAVISDKYNHGGFFCWPNSREMGCGHKWNPNRKAEAENVGDQLEAAFNGTASSKQETIPFEPPAQEKVVPPAQNVPGGSMSGLNKYRRVMNELGLRTRPDVDAVTRWISNSKYTTLQSLEKDPVSAGQYADEIKATGMDGKKILFEAHQTAVPSN